MINFKKISAFGTSALMMGMTMGMAAAANYPAPFVSGGMADVAVVYGTGAGVSVLDAVEAGNIQSNLQSFMGASTAAGTTTSTSGETAALDTGSTRIWLNTSLNTAKTTLTKTELPTTLKDYTFSGNVDSKLTATIKLVAGANAGGENSGKVIFAKQPKSSDEPKLGISMGSSATSNPTYNASVTMSAINFTHADSEGEEIMLFGQKFTIASATDLDTLVLLKSAQRADLSSTNPTVDVTVSSKTYTITLVSASDSSATIKVTDVAAGTSETKEVNEAASKKISGLQIAVNTADELGSGAISATIIAGSEKITLESGSVVTKGDNADPIDGTLAYIIGSNTAGTTNATTEIAVAVFRPDSSNDAILPGSAFVDPVFGSFKMDFASVSSPFTDANRVSTTFQNSGDNAMVLTLTDTDGNTKTVDVAYNASYAVGGKASSATYNKSIHWNLRDDSNNTIWVIEGGNLTEDDYAILGNEDYGHLVQVTQIYNNTGTDYTTDKIKFQDQLSGATYDSTFTSEGVGTVSIDGKQYTINFYGTGSEGYAYVEFATGDSALKTATSDAVVVYPTIQLKGGANLALYEPLNISLALLNNGTAGAATKTFWFPDGDGFSSVIFTYIGTDGGANWTLSGTATVGNTTAGAFSNLTDTYLGNSVTVGRLTYNFTSNVVANTTKLHLMQPGSLTNNLSSPAIVIFEEKDDNNNYEAVVVSTEELTAGTSTDGVGTDVVAMTTAYYNASSTLQSDSDITQYIDWYGTLTSSDANDADQKKVNISVPPSQIYNSIFVGASGSTVSSSGTSAGASQLGDVLVKDTEISSVSSKNLIVVGGSCINSVAANLVGGAYCGAGWTEKTTVGNGQFLIQSVADKYTTGKIALLVAGYEAADTVNAAKYLRTQTVDTMAGKKYVGTSSTSATLVTTNSTA